MLLKNIILEGSMINNKILPDTSEDELLATKHDSWLSTGERVQIIIDKAKEMAPTAESNVIFELFTDAVKECYDEAQKISYRDSLYNRGSSRTFVVLIGLRNIEAETIELDSTIDILKTEIRNYKNSISRINFSTRNKFKDLLTELKEITLQIREKLLPAVE